MRRAAALLLGLALLAVPGCAPRAQTATIFAMDTVMELTAYGDRSAVNDAVALIHELEARLSVTAPDSDIALVNANGGGKVSSDTAELLRRALELCELTGGALDCTVYPLVRAWGFTTGEYRVPGDGEITELLESVDYTGVELDGDAVTLPQGALLDLGAVAKGRTADLIADMWRSSGVKSGLINLGGNVMALGGKPGGGDWTVGIRDPFGEDILGAVTVRDMAVVTSGGYQRYFEENGVRYCHIIDPATGHPADSGLASVTIVGADGTLCDGLSTAFFVMGLGRASELWRALGPDGPAFDAVFVTDGGDIYITEGLEGSFTAMGGYENAEVEVIRRG